MVNFPPTQGAEGNDNSLPPGVSPRSLEMLRDLRPVDDDGVGVSGADDVGDGVDEDEPRAVGGREDAILNLEWG